MTRMLSISVPITLRPYDDGEGWIAVVPSIVGAMVDGDSEEEALDNMREYLQALFQDDLKRDGAVQVFSGEPKCFCKVRVVKVHLDAPNKESEG